MAHFPTTTMAAIISPFPDFRRDPKLGERAMFKRRLLVTVRLGLNLNWRECHGEASLLVVRRLQKRSFCLPSSRIGVNLIF